MVARVSGWLGPLFGFGMSLCEFVCGRAEFRVVARPGPALPFRPGRRQLMAIQTGMAILFSDMPWDMRVTV